MNIFLQLLLNYWIFLFIFTFQSDDLVFRLLYSVLTNFLVDVTCIQALKKQVYHEDWAFQVSQW